MSLRLLSIGRLYWALIPSALLVIAVSLIVTLSVQGATTPAVHAGRLDLSHWNFSRDGSVRLGGQWLYFSDRWARAIERSGQGELATVPGPWPKNKSDGQEHADGFGTYRLALKLPPAPPGDSFVIDTGQIYSAWRLYADGTLIAHGGTPAATQASERADSYSMVAALPGASRAVDLRLEVSNHVSDYGGFFTVATVGLNSALMGQRRQTTILALMVVGALFFAACYHFAFFGVARGGHAHLWFGTLAALLAARDFLFEPLARFVVPSIGQDWVWRCDFAVTALSLPAAYWFLALSFRRHLSSTFGTGLAGLCVAAAAASIVAGAATGEVVLKFVELLTGVTVVYLAYAIVRSAWEGEKGAGLALTGWVLVSGAILHDVLIDNQVISGGSVLPLGCIAFFLCLSGALTTRSHADFQRAENLSSELKDLNTELESAVNVRTLELRQKILELESQQIALEQSRAAALSANETKSRFLANMSHELRTPLNAILGFSEVIENGLFGDLSDRYVSYAKDIHTSGRHLLALIDDILDLSKIEAGKYQLADAVLALDEEIVSAVRYVEARAAAKGIRLNYTAGQNLDVVGDERALRQILVNLLTNAVKFTRPGGNVRVCVDRGQDGTTRIAIEDDGIGILPEDMDRVLQSFGQGRHDVVATEERGTGLGLPIVKGLVEAHGGTFMLESRVGVGTTATVSFPPERAAENAINCETPRSRSAAVA